MRVKTVPQRYLDFKFAPSLLKEVREHRAKYEAIHEILLANPAVLDWVHGDFCRYLSESENGREGGFTSEEILRVLVVMFIEHESYRKTVVRIENSEFLRRFVGLGFCKSMMGFSFMSKAYAALSPKTWEAMNDVLARYAKAENKIDGEHLRVDSTAYEMNIHYPTDSSLLWDSFRVLARVLKRIQRTHPELGLTHRYHIKKVKKLAQFIARNAASKSKSKQRKVKTTYRRLIDRVRWIVEVSKHVRTTLALPVVVRLQLEYFEPLVGHIIDQAQRRIFDGEVVPANEKLYSLFEEHTELLLRGKAGKRIEFGHMVLIAQTKQKFISYYRAMLKREEDPKLLPGALDAHRTLFDHLPKALAGDKGFYKNMEQLAALEEKIKTVSIAKKGRRTLAQTEREHTEAFKEGQRFRAGVEGSISVLKRAFNLNCCFFKGFKNFASSVGCAVFCHNLVLLTRL